MSKSIRLLLLIQTFLIFSFQNFAQTFEKTFDGSVGYSLKQLNDTILLTTFDTYTDSCSGFLYYLDKSGNILKKDKFHTNSFPSNFNCIDYSSTYDSQGFYQSTTKNISKLGDRVSSFSLGYNYYNKSAQILFSNILDTAVTSQRNDYPFAYFLNLNKHHLVNACHLSGDYRGRIGFVKTKCSKKIYVPTTSPLGVFKLALDIDSCKFFENKIFLKGVILSETASPKTLLSPVSKIQILSSVKKNKKYYVTGTISITNDSGIFSFETIVYDNSYIIIKENKTKGTCYRLSDFKE